YGLNAIFLLPVNLYGPRDSFDPEKSHVIPARIRKCIDAIEHSERRIEVWGTGRATREFLYVEDCARAIVLATAQYDKPDPVNLGSGQEISVRELADLVIRSTGFVGAVEWDETMPDGQPRRCLDVSRAEREFGFRANTSFAEGIQRTIDWYRGQRARPQGRSRYRMGMSTIFKFSFAAPKSRSKSPKGSKSPKWARLLAIRS